MPGGAPAARKNIEDRLNIHPWAPGHLLVGRNVILRIFADVGAQGLHVRDVIALAVLGDAFQRIDRAEADFEVGDG